MTQKDTDLIYEKFREKIYTDFSDFKEFIMSDVCSKETTYRFAEEITFREALTFYILTGTYLEEKISAENCKLLNTRFGNRILKTLYTYWNESDFFSLGIEELSTMINAFCDRLKAEKHYFDYVKIDKCYSMSYIEAYKSIYSDNDEEELVGTDDE